MKWQIEITEGTVEHFPVPALVRGDLLRLHGHLVGQRLVLVQRDFVLARPLGRSGRRRVQRGGGGRGPREAEGPRGRQQRRR